MNCKSVFDDFNLAPDLVPSIRMPIAIHGRQISWDPDYSPVPVFIRSFDRNGKTMHLFGARFEFSYSSEKRSGYTIQFVVVQNEVRPTFVQLAQNGTIVYTPPDWNGGLISAADCKKNASEYCAGPLPKWKWNDAQWPTLEEQPMTFIGQVSLPKNEVTEKYLAYNDTAFVFTSNAPNAPVYAIFCQFTRYQSAEDHYRGEASRQRRVKASRTKRP